MSTEISSCLFRNGYYYLFYSANRFDSPHYFTGVARSSSISGPYERKSSKFLEVDSSRLGNNEFGQLLGPGKLDRLLDFFSAIARQLRKDHSAVLVLFTIWLS